MCEHKRQRAQCSLCMEEKMVLLIEAQNRERGKLELGLESHS